MSLTTVALMVLAGALGAVVRYVLKEKIVYRALPLTGILIANIVGSAFAGALLALPQSTLTFVLVAGFCGALTTFSSVAYYLVPAGGERRLGRLVGIGFLHGAGSVIAAWVAYVAVALLR